MDDLIATLGIEVFKQRLELAYSLDDYIVWHDDTVSREATLKLESLVKDYKQESNPFAKIVKLEKLTKEYPTLRNGKILDTLLNYDAIEVTKDVDSLIVSSIDFINDTSIGKIDYLIDKFCARGTVNMISADSGVGKTTLFYHMAKVAATGKGDFCTRPVVTKCKVLFIQSDEDDSTMQERTTNIGCDVEGITFIPQSKGWSYDGNGLEVLESLISKYQYDLIIIDNLDDVKPRGLASLSEANAGTVMMQPLKGLATKYNACFYVLNHTPKYNTSTYVGSFSLQKPLQVSLQLERDKADPSKLYLTETKARMHKPEKFSYLRGESDNLYDFKNITGESESKATKGKSLTLPEKIVETIKSLGNGSTYYDSDTNTIVNVTTEFTRKDLIGLGLPESTLKTVLPKLRDEGKLKVVRKEGKSEVYAVTDLLG